MKGDYVLALISGFFTGLFLLPTFAALEVTLPFGIPNTSVLVIIPILWMAGIWLGRALARVVPVMEQFAKYVAAGFLSAAIDFGVFNILLAWFGVHEGVLFAVSKGMSFIGGNMNAYLWNRLWVFRAQSQANKDTIAEEYSRFLVVSIIGLGINVGVASIIVNKLNPLFGVTPAVWANIAAVVAAAVSIIWNFAGYKLIVFRKTERV